MGRWHHQQWVHEFESSSGWCDGQDKVLQIEATGIGCSYKHKLTELN